MQSFDKILQRKALFGALLSYSDLTYFYSIGLYLELFCHAVIWHNSTIKSSIWSSSVMQWFDIILQPRALFGALLSCSDLTKFYNLGLYLKLFCHAVIWHNSTTKSSTWSSSVMQWFDIILQPRALFEALLSWPTKTRPQECWWTREALQGSHQSIPRKRNIPLSRL